MERSFPAVTAKAVAVTVAGGYTCANDYHQWIPKSQIKVGEPNEYGNAEILIPVWLLRKKGIDFHRIREINGHSGEPDIVER